MPEGPSIVIIKEELQSFKGKKILKAEGNAKIDIARLENLKIKDLKSWGKHFLICFEDFFLRIHLLMFGSYRINERKNTAPRLLLKFKNGEFSFYTCSIKMIEGDPDEQYDWQTDIMSDEWNASKAEKKLKLLKNTFVCDVLLNQDIFSGVGNIIKNEVLFRTRIHPESILEALPAKKLKELVKDARDYSLQFYIWKKAFVLRAHWLIYKQKECPRCKIPKKTKYLGKTDRLTCFCDNCQVLYSDKLF
ncbi:MAG: DNA-formamidopyrimidine glycosylase family protein [Bacteroidia bacterium]